MPFSLSIGQLSALVGRIPGLKAVRDIPMPAGGTVLRRSSLRCGGSVRSNRSGASALLEFG